MLELNFTTICELMIMLFVFSVLGWLNEVILKYRQYHRFINRGFLIGPYCPIYGCGVVGVTIIVGGMIGYQGTYPETFLAGFVVCGALEYFVSWYMESLFHARWWDYSTKPMNLNGRIWIGNLILFGIGSVVVIKIVDPALFRLMNMWPKTLIYTLGISVLVIFVADSIVSYFLMNIVKREIDGREEDNSEEISVKVKELLKDRKHLERRIVDAYPNLQARPKRLTDQLKAAKKELKAATRRVKIELKAAPAAAKREILNVSGAAKETIANASGAAKDTITLASLSRLEKSKQQWREARDKFKAIQDKLTYHGDRFKM